MKHKVKTSLIETYNLHAQERDKRKIAAWKIEERRRFTKLLLENQKSALLELGAGSGQDSQFFRGQGFKTFSTDLSYEMVKVCRQKQLAAMVLDFYWMPFPEATFEAIWALNCLLHVPKQELPNVLKGIKSVLKTGALFFMGVYGGVEFEGIWEDDFYAPKRFFSFYLDQHIQEVVSQYFEIIDFKAIPVKVKGTIHFQSITLRK